MIESRDRDDRGGLSTARPSALPSTDPTSAMSLVVLTGGRSRRLGRDKATTHVGGRTLVDRILGQVPEPVPVVLVGPGIPGLPDRVTVVREDPPGGGPLAGIEAGLAVVTTPLVGVLAADMPFAATLVTHLVSALGERPDGLVDALVPVDPEGHRQPLAGAYRRIPLARALAALRPVGGRPVRALLPMLHVVEWLATSDVLADIDTPEALRAAQARAVEEGTQMEQWLTAVRETLGLEIDVDVDTILDVARDAAHHVERPAAPLTTFLLGAAVARGADPHEAAAMINRLAVSWASPPP